jgi:hypothetical protein
MRLPRDRPRRSTVLRLRTLAPAPESRRKLSGLGDLGVCTAIQIMPSRYSKGNSAEVDFWSASAATQVSTSAEMKASRVRMRSIMQRTCQRWEMFANSFATGVYPNEFWTELAGVVASCAQGERNDTSQMVEMTNRSVSKCKQEDLAIISRVVRRGCGVVRGEGENAVAKEKGAQATGSHHQQDGTDCNHSA